MKLTEPEAKTIDLNYYVKVANLIKPTKSEAKPQHPRPDQKRKEMESRHEAVRKSLWDDFQKAIQGELSFTKNKELWRAICRLHQVFTIDPRMEDGPRSPWSTLGYPISDAPESLLTAAEQADFYENILKNNGYPDFVKLAADCRKTASKLEEANVKNTFEIRSLVAACLRQADRYETFAKHPEQSSWADLKQKRPDYLEDIRAKATFWRSLRAPPSPVKLSDLVAEKDRMEATIGDIDRFAVKVALLLQQEDSAFGTLRAYDMTYDVGQRFARLLAAATTGNTLPVRAAVLALNEMVSMLHVFTTVYPETFRQVGRTMNRWPMICSHHSRLADDAKRIMAQVALGKDYDFRFDAKAKWDPRDPFTHVARGLYYYVKFRREEANVNLGLPYDQALVALPPIPRGPTAKAQSGVPQQWWNVAREVFEFTYPEPEKIHFLAGHIKGEAAKKASSIRARIMGRLKARFLSLLSRPRTQEKGHSMNAAGRR